MSNRSLKLYLINKEPIMFWDALYTMALDVIWICNKFNPLFKGQKLSMVQDLQSYEMI